MQSSDETRDFLCFWCLLWVYFPFILIVASFKDKHSGLADIWFKCLSVPSSIIFRAITSYYWHGGDFKVSHFLNFYLQVFVFSYFIILFDFDIINCQHQHFNKKAYFFSNSQPLYPVSQSAGAVEYTDCFSAEG